jgi:uncharacterized protein involved in exopolysaccharide biosynthesis
MQDRGVENKSITNKSQTSGNYFSYYLSIILNKRKLILINVLIITFLTTIISVFLPNWYKASTSILPPKEQNIMNSSGSLSTIMKNIPNISRLGGLTQKTGTYNYLAILNSRTAMEMVIKKFDLIKVYQISNSSLEDAVKELKSNVNFTIHRDDYIVIEVLDKNRQRAADIANYFADVLNDISVTLAIQEAKNNREFIELRLEKVKNDLRLFEDSLKLYQEKNKVFIIPSEIASNITGIAELYVMKEKKELELAILKKMLAFENPLIKQIKTELRELNQKLSSIPQIATDAFRIYRDVAIQQKILEFLYPLHEQAKYEEQKNIPVTLILDKAVPPEKKYKPQRMIMILSTMLSAFIIMIAFFILRDIIFFKKNN